MNTLLFSKVLVIFQPLSKCAIIEPGLTVLKNDIFHCYFGIFLSFFDNYEQSFEIAIIDQTWTEYRHFFTWEHLFVIIYFLANWTFSNFLSFFRLWSISPSFSERICANILAPKKSSNLKCKYTKALCKTFIQKSHA